MVAVTLAASSAFASPRATSTTSSTVRPSPLTTTVRMATACHPPAPAAAAGPATRPLSPTAAGPGQRLRVVTWRPAASSGDYGNHDSRHRRGDGNAGAEGRRRAGGTRKPGQAAQPPHTGVPRRPGHRDGLGPALAGCDVVVDASNS